MRFTPTELQGLFVVELAPHSDNRGLFARTFDEAAFAAAGLVHHFRQCSVSFNIRRGTLRGLHFQAEPKPETKLVRCTRGRIFDVAVDMRPNSATFKHWHGVELTAENRKALYIPAGFAHGFITLEEESEVFYHIDADYVAELARGVRWDDSALGIQWPLTPAVMSDRDASYPDMPA